MNKPLDVSDDDWNRWLKYLNTLEETFEVFDRCNFDFWLDGFNWGYAEARCDD